MIDDIVETVLKEAWERNEENVFKSLFVILSEINEKAVKIIVDDMIQERSNPDDR